MGYESLSSGESFSWRGSETTSWALTPMQLLASALAHCGLSRSFEGRARSDQVESTSEGIEKSLIAEAFYTEARKRIGFLGSSITDIQCLFLASMYEKLTLNIIKAWEYTKDACSRLQTYLARCRRMPYKQRPDHLEPRVFWSCMKAERFVAKPSLRMLYLLLCT
jgi:hypothetical protein